MASKYNLNFKFIKKSVESGLTSEEIASHYGCSKSLIYMFCKKNNIEWPKIDLIGKKMALV